MNEAYSVSPGLKLRKVRKVRKVTVTIIFSQACMYMPVDN